MLVIANVVTLSASQMEQRSDQYRSRVNSQFFHGISRVFQILLKYFNGKINFTIATPSLLALSLVLDLI